MAKSENFEYRHGNLPLWAHEMSHGWWGNTVGSGGPGSKMVSEALAQFGVLIALEAIEGRDAMAEFMDASRSGYSLQQCARGYFEMLEQGIDHPLATLGDSSLEPNQTHNLADSKGMWVWHMLRRQVGDDLFFTTLRGLIRDFAGRELSLDEVRQAFLRAAPERDLDAFFAQWLDRGGAPRLDVSWSRLADGRVEIDLVQRGAAEPFDLDLAVAIALENGAVRKERVAVQGRHTKFVADVPVDVTDVMLDPDHDLLVWRPSYAGPPMVAGVALSATADWLVPEVYVGRYTIAEFGGMEVDVFWEGEALQVNVEGDIHRLWPESEHRFRMRMGSVSFQIEEGKATAFALELDGGRSAGGIRMD